MSTSESTIKHSGCKSLLKSYRPEMKLEKMSIDLSWLGNSRIPKFVPFEWQLKAAKCYPWLRDLTPLPNTGCTATEDVNGLRTIAALPLYPYATIFERTGATVPLNSPWYYQWSFLINRSNGYEKVELNKAVNGTRWGLLTPGRVNMSGSNEKRQTH
ncbi:hypothetical protein C8J56DRAFT_888808 [Mycena floridula]|nr:hypothetical protein C8J56DRAFT_888808 [Mycena floridula]